MIKGKSILIFGGTGSLGKKLIDRLSYSNSISVYSRDELKQWTLKNDLSIKGYSIEQPKFYVGDVRDYNRVKDVIRQVKPNIIILAAALKQVDTCELSPWESIQTNIHGTQNVISAINDVHSKKLETVLYVSTDKASSPINTYGMCKAISERLITSQASIERKDNVAFVCTRYGNVLESRGSIIPLFKYQSEKNDCLTVTNPEMTRFVMTLDDSVDLISKAIVSGASGETWIPVIPSMRIGDLAELFSELSGKPIRVVGSRPGEKLHEDLINVSEATRTRKICDYKSSKAKNYVIEPVFSTTCSREVLSYDSSMKVLTKEELKKHLIRLNVFDMKLDQFSGQKIEEISTT